MLSTSEAFLLRAVEKTDTVPNATMTFACCAATRCVACRPWYRTRSELWIRSWPVAALPTATDEENIAVYMPLVLRQALPAHRVPQRLAARGFAVGLRESLDALQMYAYGFQ